MSFNISYICFDIGFRYLCTGSKTVLLGQLKQLVSNLKKGAVNTHSIRRPDYHPFLFENHPKLHRLMMANADGVHDHNEIDRNNEDDNDDDDDDHHHHGNGHHYHHNVHIGGFQMPIDLSPPSLPPALMALGSKGVNIFQELRMVCLHICKYIYM